MRVLALALLAAASAPLVAAQPVAGCTFTDCAIRLEVGAFGSAQILTGPPERAVRLGSTGLVGGGLVDAVDAVPAARERAATGRRSLTAGLVVGVAGVAALIAGSAVLADRSRGLDTVGTTETVLYIGGLGLTTAATVLTGRGRREQDRAVWEYNRAVADGALPRPGATGR